MAFIGSLIWFVFGGIWLGLSWIIANGLCCCTIIGISAGIACFNIAQAGFAPLGKKAVAK